MADRKPIQAAPALPPLRPARIAAAHGVAATLAPDTARLTRLAVSLVALALPVFGLACADMVPRARSAGAPQAAAPFTPSRGAAAATALSRSDRPVREASLGFTPGLGPAWAEVRP